MSEPAQVAKAMKDSMEQSSLFGSFNKRSIYKLPAYVTAALNPKSYNPQVVSFGPYHHGAPHLKPMEEHKWRALRHIIQRANRGDSTSSVVLEALVSGVSEVVQDLKDCYDSLDPTWHEDTDGFIRLMILDGCFMLEVLRTWTGRGVTDYEHNDPIYSVHGKVNILPFIRRDMLLLENQLPMLLLDTLVAVETGQNKETNHQSTVQLILEFFYQGKSQIPDLSLHILDVYRKSLIHGPLRMHPASGTDFNFEAVTGLPTAFTARYPISTTNFNFEAVTGPPTAATEMSSVDSDFGAIGIPTATELHESGLKFKMSNSNSLTDISFNRGVLRLPAVVVDDTTESMFLNFTAFERFHVGAGTDVVSYLCFMERLIHSERDVALLRSKGIIHNAIGSDKEVAKLFSSLSRDLTIPYGKKDLVTVLQAVNFYRKKRRNAWRAHLADLKKTYFRSPWASISVVAAIVLFALTFTQTFYAVFPKK